MSFKWHVVNEVKFSSTFIDVFVVSKPFYDKTSVYLVIQDENGKSVENDVDVYSHFIQNLVEWLILNFEGTVYIL